MATAKAAIKPNLQYNEATGFSGSARTKPKSKTSTKVHTAQLIAIVSTDRVLWNSNIIRQTTRASPLPFTTSPMSQAFCFWARMNFNMVSAWSPETMRVMPMPMLKTW